MDTDTSKIISKKADEEKYRQEVIDIIRHRFGIVIKPHQSNELQKVIVDALHKFSYTPETYLRMLAESPEYSPVLEHLIAGVTVGETYFFRDKRQVKLLEEKILPSLIERKRRQHDMTLRIWSAGSATGEEIYTIGIMLCELLPDIGKWKLQLLGTDINTTALKKALVGHYHEWSMRTISDQHKNQYFTHVKNTYIITETIRRLVNFSYLNLNDDTYPSFFNGTNAQDLIICRNVLIYFDEEHGLHLMKRLCACLVDDGYLLLGASDPVNIKGTDLLFHNGALFTRANNPLIKLKEEVEPEKPAKHIVTKPKTTEIKKKIPVNITGLPILVTRSPAAEQINILSLINEARWQEAMQAIDKYQSSDKKNVFILNAKATVLANLGKLDDAVKVCHLSLSVDSTNTQSHFILAMALLELNLLHDAESELRKVIFLDQKFVEAHYQLGLLLLRTKKHAIGVKCLRNALKIAKAEDQSRLVSGFAGLNYGKLTVILERELELHMKTKGSDYAH